MRNIAILAIALSLVGCATQAQREYRMEQDASANEDLKYSYANAKVACKDKKSCDKAFSIAKVFIQENSDMKIQISDDTIVSTYNPIRYRQIGMSATKAPGTGDSGEIRLTVSCKGLSMSSADNISMFCKQRVAALNFDFKPYVDQRMD